MKDFRNMSCFNYLPFKESNSFHIEINIRINKNNPERI